MQFIHVPRTGGRSIVRALDLPKGFEHYTVLHHINTQTLDPVTFSVVRNPWDRAYAYWRFFVNKLSAHVYPKEHVESFEQWLKDGSPYQAEMYSPNEGLSNILCHMDYYKDANGIMVVNQLLRFEKLQEDFLMYFKKELPHVGEFGATNYREQYTSQWMIDYVGGLNAELVKRFNYTF